MARCGCSDACTCIVLGINGVTVTGDGSSGDPYTISPPPAVAASTLLDVQVITADTTLTDANDVVLVDSETPAGPVEATLPAVITVGKLFRVKDYGSAGAGFTQTQAVTLNPNGNNIDGSPAIVTYPVDGDSLTVVGVTATGWAVV